MQRPHLSSMTCPIEIDTLVVDAETSGLSHIKIGRGHTPLSGGSAQASSSVLVGPASSVLKRPAAKPKSQPKVSCSWCAADYTELVATYDSKAKCFEELGCAARCKSHCARAPKRVGKTTHLRCRLQQSKPPCDWAGILEELPDGTVEFYQHPEKWKLHVDQSKALGKYGFVSLVERQAVSTVQGFVRHCCYHT